jgi:hypothetical protein
VICGLVCVRVCSRVAACYYRLLPDAKQLKIFFFEFFLTEKPQQWEQKRNSPLLNVEPSFTAANVEILTGKLQRLLAVPYQQSLQR